MLHQHEAAQFRSEMTADTAGQRRDDRLALRRQPALASIAHHPRGEHQVLQPPRRAKWIPGFRRGPECPFDGASVASVILWFDWPATILSSRPAPVTPARAVTVQDGRRPSRSGAKRPGRSRARWHAQAAWDEHDEDGRQYGSGFGAGGDAAMAAGQPATRYRQAAA